MSNWTIAGIAMLVAAVVGAIIYDLIAAFGNDVPNKLDTWSGLIFTASRAVAFIPFACGFVGGHIFWPRPEGALLEFPAGWIVSAIVGLSLVGLQAMLRAFFGNGYAFMPIVYGLIGIPFGHFFFPHGWR